MSTGFRAQASALEESESESELRLLVEQAREYAVFTLDPTGHVRSWNAGAERIHGHAAPAPASERGQWRRVG